MQFPVLNLILILFDKNQMIIFTYDREREREREREGEGARERGREREWQTRNYKRNHLVYYIIRIIIYLKFSNNLINQYLQ